MVGLEYLISRVLSGVIVKSENCRSFSTFLCRVIIFKINSESLLKGQGLVIPF